MAVVERWSDSFVMFCVWSLSVCALRLSFLECVFMLHRYESAVEFCHRGLRCLAASSAVSAALEAVASSDGGLDGHDQPGAAGASAAAAASSGGGSSVGSGTDADADADGAARASRAAHRADLLRVRRRLHEQEAMILLIHGVRLGRECARASVKHRRQFPKWCGRGAEVRAIQLLQEATRLYATMAREDSAQESASNPNTPELASTKSPATLKKNNKKKKKKKKKQNPTATAAAPLPKTTRQLAAAHYQLALLYRQLYHRDSGTEPNGLPKTAAGHQHCHPPQHGLSMPLQLMVQNAVRHYQRALTYFAPPDTAGNETQGVNDNHMMKAADARMGLLVHRDCAAVYLASAHVALNAVSGATATTGVGTDTTTSVAMADFVRALDELAATSAYFNRRLAALAPRQTGESASYHESDDGKDTTCGMIDTLQSLVDSVWTMLLFALRSILKLAKSSAAEASSSRTPQRPKRKQHSLLAPAQARLFRELYLTALQSSRGMSDGRGGGAAGGGGGLMKR